MAVQFVTALYVGLDGTRFNGNTMAIYERYKGSLKSIAMGGYSIVCYTSNAHIDELSVFFEDVPNLILKVEELTEFEHHQRIEQIKDIRPDYTEDASWRSRCVEIMWGKFYWVQRELSELSNSDYLFWIDAGLFHGGSIHDKFRSGDSIGVFDFDSITQKRNLFDDLVRHSGDKILNVSSDMVNHGFTDYMTVFLEKPRFGVAGGIFGGKKGLLSRYVTDIISEMPRVLQNNVLLKEEEIMYYIFHLNPENFTQFRFNTWYHAGWTHIYEIGKSIGFSDFFDLIAEQNP